MQIEKQVLCSMPDCYAVACFPAGGVLHAFFATDGRGGCVSVNLSTGKAETVWEGPGGTMSLVPLPHADGEFLATQCFFPGFEASASRVVRVTRSNAGWQVKPWLSLPYLHRFDVLSNGGNQYLLCCTLAEQKTSPEDWSHPGGLAGCLLGADASSPGHLQPVAGGMTRNHGYCRVETPEGDYALTSCDEGVFEVRPPQQPGGCWKVQKLLERPVSDIAVTPARSGRRLLAAIEPFHGDRFCLYRPALGMGWERVWTLPDPSPFGHAIWGGTLWGQDAFLFGFREGRRQLFAVLCAETREDKFADGVQCLPLDEGGGPSNACVIHRGEEEWVLCANRVSGEGVLYRIRR